MKIKEYNCSEQFINDEYINKLLKNADSGDNNINKILDKAETFSGLTHLDVAALLHTEKKEHIDRIFEIAKKIKQHIYGDRIVMFAPLYISDYCVNKCLYCGFRCDNKFTRRKLTQDEIKMEVKLLEKMGQKRIALEAGEDPKNCDIDYVLESLKTIYNMKSEDGEIRRANINIASTTVEDYKKLKEAGIGTYILFQETYHKDTYESVHVAGPKSDYFYHLTAFDRAMLGGVDDVGAGVLFGLYDYKFEVLALMLHNEHLENRFGVGFHTISVPRIRPADGADVNVAKFIPSDEEFVKLTAILRLAVPFTGMIVSTRETKEMRKQLIDVGISQLSGGSSTEVGGYAAREEKKPQFEVCDDRTAGEIVDWLLDEGLIPSFCTACYRSGRTGDRFMQLAKSGNIKNVCLPNALMTLQEYALDYGNDDFRNKVSKTIEKHIANIASEKVKDLTINNIADIKSGKRDLFL